MILKIQRRGRRAAKCTMDNNGQCASFTSFLYNLSGHIISELSNGAWQRTEAYLGGRHLATYANGHTYFDLLSNSAGIASGNAGLGTERAKLGYANGALAASLSESCTSGPWGDNLNCGNSLSDLHFTGKMRDSESGLDYFGARYYSGAGLGFGDLGRFMTPDWSKNPTGVPYANFANPQSLDLYSYIRNNPVSATDADGHTCADAISCSAELGAGIGTAVEPGGGTVVGAIIGGIVGGIITIAIIHHFAHSKSNPMTGKPGSISTTYHPDGKPKQTREYGNDGSPKTDVDYGHDHGQGDPHAHDWGRPSDGSQPTHADRGPGRPVQPSDPKPAAAGSQTQPPPPSPKPVCQSGRPC